MKGLLSVGSIVALEDIPEVLYMIAGYYPEVENSILDYAAVRYPAGLGDTMKMEFFNEGKISAVVFYGYLDENSAEMIERLPDFMQEMYGVITESEEIINQIEDLSEEREKNVEKKDLFNLRME